MAAAAAFVVAAATLSTSPAPSSALTLGRTGASAQLVAPQQTVYVTVRFPLRNEAQLDRLLAEQSDATSPMYRHFLTPAQFRASFGPAQSDLTRVALAMRARGFTIDRVTSQGLQLRASAATVERTFSTRLAAYRLRGTRPQVRAVGGLVLTPDLVAAHATVSAVGGRFVHRAFSRRSALPAAKPLNFLGPFGPYFTDDLKEAYGFPSDLKLDGTGRSIGIVIDSFVVKSDIQQWFTDQGIAVAPKVADVKVDGGQALAPSDPNDFDVDEASLDVEQTTGIANGAKVFVYDTPDLSDQSISDAYQQIVDENKVDVVNSSFGECELFYTAPYNIDPTTGKGVDFTSILAAQHAIYKQGNAEGITFVAASGDEGAYECVDAATFSKFILGVSSPADDTLVTAVGGTNLKTSAKPATSRRPNASVYKAENAQDDPLLPYDFTGATDGNGNPILSTGGVFGSGGGVSVLFAKPLYQAAVAANAFGRTLPDIAGHMGGCPVGVAYPIDPSTGFPACPAFRSADLAIIQGGVYGLIGTSASSPDFVGELTLLEQYYGTRVGNANVFLYAESLAQAHGALPVTAFRTGINGNNGLASNALPYDEVTGLGTTYGAGLGQLSIPLAADPGDPSNP